MTLHEIDNLKETELDAAVAMAMGWTPPKMTPQEYMQSFPLGSQSVGGPLHYWQQCYWKGPEPNGYQDGPPCAHSDANRALEFAKFVSKKVGRPMGASLYAEHASAWFGPLMFADCLDLAEAICRAGLKALAAAKESGHA